MRRRLPTASKLLLAIAVLSGGSAFALVRGYQAEAARLRPSVGDDVAVVVATASIARSSVISADDVEVRRLPATYAPPGRFARIDRVAGRTSLTAIRPGEAVTATRLAPPGGAVAAVTPPGTVGVPIHVDVPPHAVRPGDLVDVLATFGGRRPHTETVAESVEVLLVLSDSSIAAGGIAPSSTPTLVLAATPDLSSRLAYAAAFATLSVAVRPAGSPAPGVAF